MNIIKNSVILQTLFIRSTTFTTKRLLSCALKRTSLEKEVGKITPKKFYEIDSRLERLAGKKHSSLLQSVVKYGSKKLHKIIPRVGMHRTSHE
jgi:hypothetical protein